MLRAALLLLRLRGRRLMNLMSGRRKKAPRSGTGRPMSWALPAFVLVLQLAGCAVLSWSAITQSRIALDEMRQLDAHEMTPLSPAVLGEVGLLAALACAVGLLMAVGSRELASPDWDLEWLATLPIPMRQLLAVRLVERAALNPVAVITVWTLFSIAALHQGLGWLSPLLGLVTALPLLVLVGALHLLADTGLRMRLTPPRLRNVQALCALGGLVGLYVLISAGQSDASFVHGWARELPEATRWLPTSLAARALAPGNALDALGCLAIEWGLCALAVVAILLLLGHMLRDGLVTSGARESARGQATVAIKPPRRFITALQARELKLLSRDRTFLVQTMIMPVVILGAQFLLNMRLWDDVLESPRGLGSVAFGLMAYALMFSTFQTLAAEGHALWLLFTFPESLDRLLREKARLWSVVAMIFPAAIFAVGLVQMPNADWSVAGVAALVLVGVPIYATIGTCLGVLGWDPLALDQRRRIRPGWGWLYIMLASVFAWAVATDSWWNSAVVVVLTGALALSLWQRVRDRLPWLLDAGSRPPPRVSLSDGMLAALLFFVLQAAAMIVFIALLPPAPEYELPTVPIGAMLFAYVTAGALTCLTMRIVFLATHAQGAPRYGGGTDFLRGALLPSFAAVGLAAVTVLVMSRLEPFSEALAGNLATFAEWPIAMPLVFIALDPLFEEYIFRGLIFGGLRRSRGLLFSAAASAAIFAVVHQPLSAPPVFVLGLLTALAYERSRSLAAPILVHATYNAAVIAFQVLAAR